MFKVSEILKATKGKLIFGPEAGAVSAVSSDTRSLRRNEAFIALKGDNFDGHDFIEAAISKKVGCIICERGRAGKSKAACVVEVRDTTAALGDLARYRREKFALPVIAVTGSNGKTTAKEMIAWVLSARYKVLKNEGTKNNHIGVPSTLLNLDNSHELAVLEIGTNHFGEIAYLTDICRPNIGVITNIGPSHLEFFRDLKGVLREKSALLKGLKGPGIAILNNEDKLLKKIKPENGMPLIFGTGVKNKADFRASGIALQGGLRLGFILNGKYRFAINSPGIYNISNSLAAIAAGRIFGLSYREIARRLASFKFPQGRLNIKESGKVRFIDDTYNSSPLSLKEALKVLADIRCRGRKILVMGDMLELGAQKERFHRELIGCAAGICGILVAVGRLTCLASEEALKKGFRRENIFTCATSAQAKEILFDKIRPHEGDVILVKGSRAMKMEEVIKI